jgi:hypothetical protein
MLEARQSNLVPVFYMVCVLYSEVGRVRLDDAAEITTWGKISQTL